MESTSFPHRPHKVGAGTFLLPSLNLLLAHSTGSTPTAAALAHFFSCPSVTVSTAPEVGGFLEGSVSTLLLAPSSATPSSRDIPSGDSADRWSAAQRLVTLSCQHLGVLRVLESVVFPPSPLSGLLIRLSIGKLFTFGRPIKVLAKVVGWQNGLFSA